jgi:hypothetical protein
MYVPLSISTVRLSYGNTNLYEGRVSVAPEIKLLQAVAYYQSQ